MIPREVLKKVRQIEMHTNRTSLPRIFCALAVCSSLLLLCSCASTPDATVFVPASELPADVAMNKGAGRGGHLTVTLQLADGEESQFVVDTGCPITFLPKSWESKLGKRLGTETFQNFETKRKTGIYAAPKVFLGNTPLVTGHRVGISGDKTGILGMDCLGHYCLQLDFQAGKLRFLDPEHAITMDLGQAFPLKTSYYAYIRHGGLFQETSTETLIDTGHPYDGVLPPMVFERIAGEQPTQTTTQVNLVTGARTNLVGILCFSSCVWSGNTYTALVLDQGQPGSLGLRFLARHLVTFDFPRRTMYLKQTSAGPLIAQNGQSILDP